MVNEMSQEEGRQPPRFPAVNVYGHFNDAMRFGDGARGFVASFRTANLDHRAVHLSAPHAHSSFASDSLNLLLSNPWVMDDPRYWKPVGSLDPSAFSTGYNIGYWVWESATTAPDGWAKSLSKFHEIWTASEFSAQCLERTLGVRAHVLPPAVAPGPPCPSRDRFGLPAGKFLFCFVFDGKSDTERKNVVGVVEAFRRAFPQGGAGLVLKARALRRPDAHALKEVMGDGRDVYVRIREDTEADTLALIASCDAYVSLHRAEAFGLTMAEAMAMGKPVIATDYSGNTEFMNEENSFLVSHKIITTDQRYDDYPPGTSWSEPDIEHAAAIMRVVRNDPDHARAKAAAAVSYMSKHHSYSAVGAKIRARIDKLYSTNMIDAQNTVSRKHIASKNKEKPRVLVLTPVRDAAAYLPDYREALLNLEYPKDRISVGFLEGDSRDGTDELLRSWMPEFTSVYRRSELMHHRAGLQLSGPRWDPGLQRSRRSMLARMRNRLLQATLRDEDLVLWIDADVISYLPETLQRLVDADRPIITPNCVKRFGGPSFDLNTYQNYPTANDEKRFLHDGIVQPPKGVGRRYLDSFRGDGPVRLDGVGGTMLLIRADLHREGLIFPAYSHDGYIETEGLAKIGRDLGIDSWGHPDVEILHADR